MKVPLVVAAIAATAWLAGCNGSAPGVSTSVPAPTVIAQPYSELKGRTIRALAPDRVEDLLAGRGAGYALAAELNHYPGPTHVLELATDIQMSPSQDMQVREVFDAMQQDARALGARLVELEAELDERFRGSQITEAEITELTSEIADVEGRLRSVHLAAHVKMKEILSPEQVNSYDQLRGYSDASEGPVQGHGRDHTAH